MVGCSKAEILYQMSKDAQEGDLADQLQGTEEHVSARRRLIKGSFAAPAALTLFSGGAMAATSTGACMARSAASEADPQDFVTSQPSTTTGWLRVQASSFLPNGSNKTPSYWVSHADIVAVANVAGLKSGIKNNWIVAGKFLCVESGTGASAGTIYNSPVSGMNGVYASVSRWYSVLVDASGQIIGIGTYNAGYTGNSVSQSCWTSFIR
jgi:hypothetical protein